MKIKQLYFRSDSLPGVRLGSHIASLLCLVAVGIVWYARGSGIVRVIMQALLVVREWKPIARAMAAVTNTSFTAWLPQVRSYSDESDGGRLSHQMAAPNLFMQSHESEGIQQRHHTMAATQWPPRSCSKRAAVCKFGAWASERGGVFWRDAKRHDPSLVLQRVAIVDSSVESIKCSD